MDVGCSLKGFCSLNHSELVSFIMFALTLSPTFSANFLKPRKSCDGGNGLSLHPYAHPPQDKILKHLKFVGMQFERFYSLYHSVVASFEHLH